MVNRIGILQNERTLQHIKYLVLGIFSKIELLFFYIFFFFDKICKIIVSLSVKKNSFIIVNIDYKLKV